MQLEQVRSKPVQDEKDVKLIAALNEYLVAVMNESSTPQGAASDPAGLQSTPTGGLAGSNVLSGSFSGTGSGNAQAQDVLEMLNSLYQNNLTLTPSAADVASKFKPDHPSTHRGRHQG